MRPLLLAALLALAACSSPSSVRDCAFAKVIRVSPDDHLTPQLEADLLKLDRNVRALCP